MRCPVQILVVSLLLAVLAGTYCSGQEATAGPAADPVPAPTAPAAAPAVPPASPAPVVQPAAQPTAQPSSGQQQFTYPATVDSMMRLWGIIYEVCGKAGVQPWDVHLDQIADDGVVIKVQDKFFAAFVREMATVIGEPLLRVNKLGDQIGANATCDYEMPWASDRSTVLDDQLRSLGASGIKVQSKHYQIIVVCAGTPILQDVFGLFSPPKSAAAAPATPAPSTVPAPAPAPTTGATSPPAPAGGAVKP